MVRLLFHNGSSRYSELNEPNKLVLLLLLLSRQPRTINTETGIAQTSIMIVNASMLLPSLGEISHHFKESAVSVSEAHVFDITCSDALLTGCHSL